MPNLLKYIVSLSLQKYVNTVLNAETTLEIRRFECGNTTKSLAKFSRIHYRSYTGKTYLLQIRLKNEIAFISPILLQKHFSICILYIRVYNGWKNKKK